MRKNCFGIQITKEGIAKLYIQRTKKEENIHVDGKWKMIHFIQMKNRTNITLQTRPKPKSTNITFCILYIVHCSCTDNSKGPLHGIAYILTWIFHIHIIRTIDLQIYRLCFTYNNFSESYEQIIYVRRYMCNMKIYHIIRCTMHLSLKSIYILITCHR